MPSESFELVDANSLGFNNTAFPFAALACMTFAAFVTCLLEWFMRKMLIRK